MKEIIVKIIRENCVEYIADMPQIAVKYWKENIAIKEDFDEEKESLVVLILNSKLKVKAHSIVSVGIVNETLCHAREVFRPAIAYSGIQIILIHNHPSGDPTPSSDDISTTRDMQEAGKLLGIPLLDHVIVSSNGESYKSLKESGLLIN